MDIEAFKQRYSAELDGLTSARVTTLWKKSKTLSPAELVDAIKHSRAAQDKQKRGKDTAPVIPDMSTLQQVVMVSKEPRVEPENAAVDIPTPNEWPEVCARLNIDYPLLLSKVRSLHKKVSRIDELHSVVNDLLELRERRGQEVDVLQALS